MHTRACVWARAAGPFINKGETGCILEYASSRRAVGRFATREGWDACSSMPIMAGTRKVQQESGKTVTKGGMHVQACIPAGKRQDSL
jgi:hypothetical protein